jgi:hypothetical protein
MKKYLTVSIDVEPDCSHNWQYSNPLVFDGVHKGIKERLQPLFEEFGVVPTYMINNVVLEDDSSVEILKHLKGNYELGTHLHPEFIEPDKGFTVYAGKQGLANCCFYPPGTEFEKIKNITDLFESRFGYKPTSFRAGRYSAGENTISSLARLGYLVDTSITPHVCWDDKSMESPIDFRNAPEQPYLIDEHAIIREDTKGKVLEVPISIALVKRNMLREFIVAAGGLRHELRKYKPIWMRPFYSSAEEMIMIARQYESVYGSKGRFALNMMFHNVEILPGLSPYSKSESDCVRYIKELRRFFSYCRDNHYSCVGLSQLYALFKS